MKKYTYRMVAQRCRALTMMDGIVGLFNDATDSRDVIDIREVSIYPCAGTNPALPGAGLSNICGTWGLYRITDSTQTSATVVISPTKRNAGSADLPSQVVCHVLSNVTTTDLLLNRSDTRGGEGMLASNAANVILASGGSCSVSSGMPWIDGYRSKGTSTERLLINAGEGLALVQTQFGIPAGWSGSCTLRDTTSGACYDFFFDTGTPARLGDQSIFAIMNNTGSGVTLELVRWDVAPQEEVYQLDTVVPPVVGRAGQSFRLARIDGYTFGTAIPITKHNSGSPDALVTGLQNFQADLIGTRDGINWDLLQSAGQNLAGATAAAAPAAAKFQRSVGQFRAIVDSMQARDAGCSAVPIGDEHILYVAPPGDDGILVSPSRGFGILAGTLDNVYTGHMNLWFTVEIVFTQKRSQKFQEVRYAS